ncbi:DUF5999 family protein [Streptomyces sp. NPDC002476]|uniref:DUF5999 family protein n=1 Tax=Streptomyces sp. NPDC002476 TaxID=3364648 RepID=UPI0036CFEF99
MCEHFPPCPGPDAPDCESARITERVDVQGWAKLCNGALVFDDFGALLPDGKVTESRRLTLAGWRHDGRHDSHTSPIHTA